jgi:hypothetical protein
MQFFSQNIKRVAVQTVWLTLDREKSIGKGGWPPFDIKFLTGPLGGPSLWLFLRAF